LIDCPLTGRDDAIERDFVAGPDDEHVTDGDVVDGNRDFLAVPQDLRFVWSHLDERFDRPARTTDCVVLERVRQENRKRSIAPSNGAPIESAPSAATIINRSISTARWRSVSIAPLSPYQPPKTYATP